MDPITSVTNKSNVLHISIALQKLSSAIEKQRDNVNKSDSDVFEFNCLKSHCLSENVQLSLFSCQTLYKLVEKGIIDTAIVLKTFLTMLSSVNNPAQCMAVSEGIFKILLLDLKLKSAQLKRSEDYHCPFNMKTPQHPVITILLQSKHLDIIDIGNRICAILNHRDKFIRSNSIKFLQPAIIYVFCNPYINLNIKSSWINLLTQKTSAVDVTEIFYEIIRWNRITPETSINTTLLLMETVECMIKKQNFSAAIDFQYYLLAIVHSLVDFAFDPSPALISILSGLQQHDAIKSDDAFVDYILISIAQIIHNISPFYLDICLHLVKILINDKHNGNLILRNMILDGLTTRYAIDGRHLSTATKKEIEGIMKRINEINSNKLVTCKQESLKIDRKIIHFHPLIAMNSNVVRLSYLVCEEAVDEKLETTKNLLSNSNQHFSNTVLHQFIRAILISSDKLPAASDIWLELFELLVRAAQSDSDISSNTIYFVLNCLTKEKDNKRQLKLLHSLKSFAKVKENVPLILNTFRALATSNSPSLQMLAIDLYTQLWKTENRIYQILYKSLTADSLTSLSKVDQWEVDIVKAHAIKEICNEKSSQHGIDLIGPLSQILNSANGKNNELAITLALDAILVLCINNVVNIASTWKVLRNLFDSESRPRVVKSLCKFFGEVPSLKCPTAEYESLYGEALRCLWKFTLCSYDVGKVQNAFKAMQNFNFFELDLKSIPEIYYENIKLPPVYQKQILASENSPDEITLTPADVVPYIPGECWIELIMMNVYPDARLAAVQFVTHLLESEISQFRSGAYTLAEGRKEPDELHTLHARSPLRSLTKSLKDQSDDQLKYSTIELDCLQCLSTEFSRPIPPLNWAFLSNYIEFSTVSELLNSNDQFNMMKYSLTIASNQFTSSSTARHVMETYVKAFDLSTKSEKEILMTFELLLRVRDSNNHTIFFDFISSALEILQIKSEREFYKKNCSLEVALSYIVSNFTNKSLIKEDIDVFLNELNRLNKLFDVKSEIYSRYVDSIVKLPCEAIEALTIPSEWTLNSFAKSLIIRARAVASQKKCINSSPPLMWLNALIDNVVNANDPSNDALRQMLLFQEYTELLQTGYQEKDVCDWIMYFLGKIQSEFTVTNSDQNAKQKLFYLDFLTLSIVVASGCSIFVEDNLKSQDHSNWLKLFPESLWLLSTTNTWDNCMPRVFEFLFHLHNQETTLPVEYKQAMRDTLVCVKNHKYFLQKSMWMKYTALNIE